MITYRKNLYKTIVILFILFINFLFCKQQETITTTEQPSPQDSTRANVQEIMLNNQSEFEKNFDSLMELIKEKEAELKKAEQKLKRRSAEIKEKEQQLAKIETEIRQFRKVTYFILVIGLVLVFIGLTLIFLRRKSEPNRPKVAKS
jgi:septal ring factor EnvC (AmiA/AmiB activator)